MDRDIGRVAGKQHGLITTAQLQRVGITSGAITKRVRAGKLHVMHRAVYAVGHGALSLEGRWHAAVLAAGEGALLSHLAAASLWQIWRRQVPTIDVLVPRQRRPIEGVVLHHCRALKAGDARRRNGIPVTSVARTILDLGDVLTPWQLANVIHEAEFRRRFDRRALECLLARSRGRRAVTVVREALAIHDTGSAGTMSDLEDEFLAALGAARITGYLVNAPIDVGDGGSVRPDLHWPEARVAVEVDGRPHARPMSRDQDRGRDARLQAAGWTVLRTNPGSFEATIAQVRAGLATA